jgi:hypothetical protein
MNEKEKEMIKFCLELNGNCVGWDLLGDDKIYIKSHNDDYTILKLTNNIEYRLSKEHKNNSEIHNYTMINFFPEKQLTDDDCLTFCGDGDIYYGS